MDVLTQGAVIVACESLPLRLPRRFGEGDGNLQFDGYVVVTRAPRVEDFLEACLAEVEQAAVQDGVNLMELPCAERRAIVMTMFQNCVEREFGLREADGEAFYAPVGEHSEMYLTDCLEGGEVDCVPRCGLGLAYLEFLAEQEYDLGVEKVRFFGGVCENEEGVREPHGVLMLDFKDGECAMWDVANVGDENMPALFFTAPEERDRWLQEMVLGEARIEAVDGNGNRLFYGNGLEREVERER